MFSIPWPFTENVPADGGGDFFTFIFLITDLSDH